MAAKFMIDKNFLQSYAIKAQTSFNNIARECVQQLFLSNFYQIRGSENFLFRGGTALRLIFRSPRFSEDLDFSAISPTTVFEKLLLDTLEELRKTNFEFDLALAEKTTGGYLAKILVKLYGQHFTVLINISQRRKNTDQGERYTVSGDYFPAFLVQMLEKNSLVNEKIEALLARSKPRDFFDLYFILRSNLLASSQKVDLKKVIPVLQKTRLDFSRELKVFLPKSYWPLIKDFNKILMGEIERELGRRNLI